MIDSYSEYIPNFRSFNEFSSNAFRNEVLLSSNNYNNHPFDINNNNLTLKYGEENIYSSPCFKNNNFLEKKISNKKPLDFIGSDIQELSFKGNIDSNFKVNNSNSKIRRNTYQNQTDKEKLDEKFKNLYKNKYNNILCEKLIENLQNSNNHIMIYTLNSIFLTFIHASMINFNTLNSIRSIDSKMLLNEYRKRYENFCDVAIEIDKELRPLSIIINKLYDDCKLIVDDHHDYTLSKISSHTNSLTKKVSSKMNDVDMNKKVEDSNMTLSFSVLKLIVSIFLL